MFSLLSNRQECCSCILMMYLSYKFENYEKRILSKTEIWKNNNLLKLLKWNCVKLELRKTKE